MSLANWTTRVLVGGTQSGGTPLDESGGGSAHADAQRAPPPRPAPPSLVGSRIGPYLITKRLGAGGVGEVFKGLDVMLKREVAIKVLRHELALDPVFVERFSREAQIHGRLSHPNVAGVHAFLHEGETQFMVMEFVAGISLDEFVRTGGPVPVRRALGIFRRALDGIEHAHRCGVVHRDIKPANIMLADNGQVKVMDFGIARALDSQEHLTRVGHVAGTAKSMSPEQIRGAQADVRSDIYSLGIVLYTLLAGRAPFDGETDHALMKAQLEQAPPPLHALVDQLPPKVEAAVMRALEKNPAARFQSVGEFASVIDACLAELGEDLPLLTEEVRGDTSEATVVREDVHASAATAVNLEIGGAKQMPRHAAAKAAPKSMPRGLRRLDHRAGAVALALAALVAGVVAAWPYLPDFDEPDAVPSLPYADEPPLAQAPVPVEGAASAALAALPAQAAAPVAEPPPVPLQVPTPEPTTTTTAQPTTALSVGEAAMTHSLAIQRVPADNTQPFKPGERIKLRVVPSHDAYVYCYLQDEARRILRFYPNRFSKSALVRAGEPLEIPGNMRFELVANSRGVTETVACFASERDLMRELPKTITGTDFTKLRASSLDEVRSAFARIDADTLAQASFRVEF